MRKLYNIFILAFLTVLLVACGDKEKVGNADVSYNHNFAEFNLEVDYTPTKKYEASFEKSVDGLEVEIEDQLNDEKLRGDKAFEDLNPLLERLTFDANTSNEEIMNEIISVFGLDDSFAEFELEVLFKDGTVKEFKYIK